MLRSVWIFLRMPGRCTFTATSSPVFRRARWTCAMDAAASGSCSNSSNSCSGVPFRQACTTALICSQGTGSTAICSVWNAST
jgi:hypothetical protein